MEQWKRNLWTLYAGQFLAMAAMSSITPFLPLYLQQLGLTDPEEVRMWAGIIFGANLLTAFIFSPLWGKLADRYGCKLMLIRSGIGMAVTITLMGAVTTPMQLLLLRLLNGVVAGFGPAAVALIAANTPEKRSGYALGILHSGSVAGTICGPLLGGLLADLFGIRAVFSCLGLGLFTAALIVIFWVKESFKKEEIKETTPFVQDFKKIVSKKPLASLFVSAFMIRLALVGTLPLIPLYVQELTTGQGKMAFLIGLTTAVLGVANMISAPQLGKLGDRFGSQYVLVLAGFGAMLFLIPQAFVRELWLFIVLRFCTGLCLGGLTPSIHALIGRYAPEGMKSRTYSYSNCALFLGGLAGAVGMGAVTSRFGLSMMFIGSAVLLLAHQIWVKRMILDPIRNQ